MNDYVCVIAQMKVNFNFRKYWKHRACFIFALATLIGLLTSAAIGLPLAFELC